MAQWRLRGDLLRLATYYRVTGSRRKAERRRRADAAKERFQRWAATVVAARRQQCDAEAVGSVGINQLRTSPSQINFVSPPPAGSTVVSSPPAGDTARTTGGQGYREARAYKRRATPDEMQARRLTRRTRRTSTAQSMELGKRLRDDMEEIGRRCKERRGDG